MANIPVHAICVKRAVILNQTVGTQHEIFPGRLIKIVVVNFDSCVIKLYDHDSKSLGKELFKCDNQNVKKVDGNVWSVISQLKKGDNITVNLATSSSNSIKVNFCIKNICDIPSLGGGQQFVLDLINNNLTEDSELFIHHKYYVDEQSAYCIRGDKLVEGLIIHQQEVITAINSPIQNNYQTSKPLNLSTNHDNVPRYISAYSGSQVGFGNNNEVERDLQNVQDGFRDLNISAEKEPNGTNEFAHANDQLRDQHWRARNERINVSTPNTRHLTPSSEENYQGHNLRNFREPSIATSNNAIRQQYFENRISNEQYQNYLEAPQPYYSSQHTGNLPVEGNYKPIERNERSWRNDDVFPKHSAHFTPQSNVNYLERNRDFRTSPIATNVPDAILNKSQKNIQNSSINRNMESFQLPVVNPEGNYLETPQPLSNYSSQHTNTLPTYSGNQIGFRGNTELDREFHNVREGLRDVRTLTEMKPNSMNAYAHTKAQLNIRDQELQASKHSRYFTPQSNADYHEHNISGFQGSSIANNGNYNLPITSDLVPASILHKSQQNTQNSSISSNLGPFQLPAVNSEETPNLSPSYASQHTENYDSSTKQQKLRQLNQNNQNKKQCHNCHTLVDNIIELDCQHLFCPRCLVGSFSDNLLDTRCPFKKGNFQCNFKLDLNHIRDIFNTIDITVPATKTKPDIVQTRRIVNKVEEAEFGYNDDDSNEVIFHCKQNGCKGVWIVDRTEGRNTYKCPICIQYNCIKCQVIHEGMTCEEYNQHNSAPSHNYYSRLANSRIEKGGYFKQCDGPNDRPTWECQHCTYSDNLMITAICMVCSRTNDTIKSQLAN